MNVYSTSGFYRASISKVFLGTSVVSSFALTFPFLYYRHLFVYKPDQILNRQQIWRLFTAKLVFLDFKDLMVCSVLIYYLRIFERRYGSRKFASYMVATSFFATCLELLSYYGLKKMEFKLDALPSGPLCVLYALLVPYYFDLPRVAIGNVLGIPVTGKSLVYILALQAASGSKESVMVAACGILSGLLWRINFMKMQTVFKIPNFIAKTFQTVFGSVFDSSSPTEDTVPMGATLELQRQERYDQLEQQMLWQSMQQQLNRGAGGGFGGFFNFNGPQNLVNGPGIFGNQMNNGFINEGQNENMEDVQPQPVSEEQVQQLVEMGFNRERVRDVLQQSNNDINVATNTLLQDVS